ncbi:MAG: hypothetical protein ABI629_09160 [bacterium]
MRRWLLALSVVALSAAAARAEWNPAAFGTQDTLEFLTTAPNEAEHWSTVWLVVLDGQLYIRLGGRAAGRIESNTTKPKITLRIAGQEFDDVLAEPAPDQAAAVAKAMHDKYWSDVFVQFFNHPLTMRLTKP